LKNLNRFGTVKELMELADKMRKVHEDLRILPRKDSCNVVEISEMPLINF